MSTSGRIGLGMSVWRLTVLVGATITVTPEGAMAAGGEGVGSLLYPAINFSAYVGILVFLLRKRFCSEVSTRKELIAALVERGEELLEEAKRKRDAIALRSAQFGQEKAELQARLRGATENERSEILDEARARSSRLLVEARQHADAEVRATERRLRHELTKSVVTRARELFRNRQGDELDGRFIEKATPSMRELH